MTAAHTNRISSSIRVLAVTPALALALVSAASAQDAFEYLLVIGGATAQEEWLKVHSVSFDGSPTPRTLGDVVVVKEVDRSSPTLRRAHTGRTRLPEMAIAVRRAGSRDYLVYTLKDVLISSHTVSNGSYPRETMTLNYSSMEQDPERRVLIPPRR